MKNNYDVFAIGNALVDMEFEVTNEFLLKNNVEKGLMTLVEQDRQAVLLETLDGHQHKRGCGGSAANSIIAISQLGGNSFYSCKVANDETGEFFKKDLLAKGVSTNLEIQSYDGITGKCMVFVTPDADRTMNTYLGISAGFSSDQVLLDELKKSKWLYIEGYLVTGETGLNAAIKSRQYAKDNNVKIALTFSDPGIVSFFKEGFTKILANEKIDLIFCNEAEAMSYTGTSNVDEAFEALKNHAHTFAITTGAKGALVYDGKEKIVILTSKVEAVDTNGAGDIFAGSFLYAITNGHNYKDAGVFACACASKLVTQFSARLNTEDILKIKNSSL